MGVLRAVFVDTTHKLHNKNHYGMLLVILSCIRWSSNTVMGVLVPFFCKLHNLKLGYSTIYIDVHQYTLKYINILKYIEKKITLLYIEELYYSVM